MGIQPLALLLSALAGMIAGETAAQSRAPEPVRQGFRVCNQTGSEWAGKVPICVSRDAFTIRSGTCGEQHYRRMFIEVNTGDEQNLFAYDFRQGS